MPHRRFHVRIAMACWFATASAVAAPQTAALPSDDKPPAEARLPERIAPKPSVVLPRVGDYRRATLHVDPIEAAVARGDWAAPKAGDTVLSGGGSDAAWRAATDTPASDLAGGYAYAEFDSPAAGVMLLEAPGAAAVWLNGEWFPGDPYGVGWFRLPVEIRAGANRMLTHLARPAARPVFVRPSSDFAWIDTAATVPDLLTPVEGIPPEPITLSIPLVNAKTAALEGARLRTTWGEEAPVVTPLRRIDSLLVTPITIQLAPPKNMSEEPPTLRVELLTATDEKPDEEDADQAAQREVLAATTLTFDTVDAMQPRTDTFVSEIDGSVQAYRVLPATKADAATVVVLHDAGESPAECLDDYEQRDDVHFVAPGCRGRWAFDGEDWSRQDALEALDDFQKRQERRKQPIDARRVALLGRGMGGHTALHLATLQPDRFAAVGIVDGWLSFFSHGGGKATPANATPIARLLGRQAAANDPLRVIENLRGVGVSILVTADGRVSPDDGRTLRERLGEFHNDFSYREPSDAVPLETLRSEQIDWLTNRRVKNYDDADTVQFATPDLNAASTLGWASIRGVILQGEVARVELDRDLANRQVVGTTQNVERLRLSLEAFGSDAEVAVQLDGAKPVTFEPGRNGDQVTLARDEEGVWRRIPTASGPMARVARSFKTPNRAGGFKSLFCCRPLLVYGTRGDEAIQSWAAAKARYDAHLFLYRGAGRLEVQPDSVFRESFRNASTDRDRSVVLYGNVRTNAAWTVLQQEAFLRRGRTIRLDTGQASLGSRPEQGTDLSVLALRPRPGSGRASLGVVGGTGLTGMRMTTRLRYFWAGIAYPDLLIYGPEAIDTPADPSAAKDVRAAGYFDADWGTNDARILWRDLAI
ncbi:MAG: hypothetical protein AAF266_08335 [Planctomycetota bacterium]